jgi:hypothetical protein
MKQNKNVVVQNPITEMKYNPFTSIPPDTKQVTVRNEMPTCVSCTTSIVDCEEPTKFTPLEIDGKTYWLDDDHVVYKETEEGYEQVGSYDPESGEVAIEDDEEEQEEEEEEEEEGIETEEFIFKGQTYYRDSDNNVYNEDGDQLGIWNGKKIV